MGRAGMDTVTIRVDRDDIEGATNVQQFQGALTFASLCGHIHLGFSLLFF